MVERLGWSYIYKIQLPFAITALVLLALVIPSRSHLMTIRGVKHDPTKSKSPLHNFDWHGSVFLVSNSCKPLVCGPNNNIFPGRLVQKDGHSCVSLHLSHHRRQHPAVERSTGHTIRTLLRGVCWRFCHGREQGRNSHPATQTVYFVSNEEFGDYRFSVLHDQLLGMLSIV